MLLIVLCIIIEILVVVSINLYSYFDAVDSTAKQALQISRDRFKSLEIHDVTLMSSTMDALKSDREIRNIFISKNRDRLLDVTSPLFSVLKQKYGITHWYFINPEPDSTCFLRVHSPQQFGDKIGRITYRNALKSGSAGSGLELGKTAFALRVVHPYYNGTHLIGYMELGREIDHFFDMLKQETGNEYKMVVMKKYLKESDWASFKKNTNERNDWADLADVVT